MYLKLLARTGAALFSALALAGVAATSAMAASNSAVTYSGAPALCVKGTATQDPAYEGSLLDIGGTTAAAEPYSSDCSTPLHLPLGRVKTKADVYKWTGSSWAYCTGSDWVYGGYTPGYQSGEFYYPAGYGAQAYGPRAGSCGAGYYGVKAAAFAWANPNPGYYGSSGRWNGGWVWSGYEYIP
jgi:hypothetical protein